MQVPDLPPSGFVLLDCVTYNPLFLIDKEGNKIPTLEYLESTK